MTGSKLNFFFYFCLGTSSSIKLIWSSTVRRLTKVKHVTNLSNQFSESPYLILDPNFLLINTKGFVHVILIQFLWGRFLLICTSPAGFKYSISYPIVGLFNPYLGEYVGLYHSPAY